VVVDAVTGSGCHKIASRLHLSPGQPDTGTQVVAMGATAVPYQSPYYERFGASQQRNRLDIEATSELPWVGGWLIRCGLKGAADEVACDLQMKDGTVTLNCDGGFQLSATWRVGDAPAGAGARVSLCSVDRESAT
jgi:hypothetical protein